MAGCARAGVAAASVTGHGAYSRGVASGTASGACRGGQPPPRTPAPPASLSRIAPTSLVSSRPLRRRLVCRRLHRRRRPGPNPCAPPAAVTRRLVRSRLRGVVRPKERVLERVVVEGLAQIGVHPPRRREDALDAG